MPIKEWLKEERERLKEMETIKNTLSQRDYQWVDPEYLMDDKVDEKYLRSEDLVKVLDSQGHLKILRPECTYNLIDAIKDDWSGQILRLQYDGVIFERKEGEIKTQRQIGAELIGLEEEEGDLEILEIITDLSQAISGMVVISHSGFLRELLDMVNLSPEDEVIFMDALHHKNEAIIRSLDLKAPVLEACLKMVDLQGYDLQEISELLNDDKITQALVRLKTIKAKFAGKVSIDLALTTKFHYYSGILCQVFVKDCNEPLILGGRYQGLMAGMKKEMTAIGFALDFETYMRKVKR